MAELPKRVWSGKKQVYSWKKPVWVKDWKLWVYDPNFKEVTNWQYYSPNRWGNVSSDAELQIYDDKDSLNPTDIGTFEDWLSSTYQFVDWDGTVLKSWTVKDWETPVAPTNPTREHYTFTGWNPTVWPISKNTTYSAVYESSAATITLTWAEDCYGTAFLTITPDTINANIWDGISLAQNFSSITIGEQVATVKGNLNDEVFFDTIDGTLTACFHGAIPTSCTQVAPTESALPATVAWAATFYFDCPLEDWPVGGIQVSPSAFASSLTVDGRPSTTWTDDPGKILTINPVNVNISWATTIELSNPTLSGWVAEALGADVSSGNIELEIIVTEGTYTGNVEFDFVVDGFTMAHVRLYLNVTVEGASY